MYKCMKCGKELQVEEKVRCQFCGFRILVKTRPEIVRRVVAR